MTEAPTFHRRAVLKVTLGAGFCAAVSPVFAQAISTPATGLSAGEVKIPSEGVEIPAYRAAPEGAGPFPVVLVIHEIFGVHEHIKDVCRRFAKLGYYAIAPDLFAREGDASAEKDMGKLMSNIVGKTPEPEVAADLDATLAFAAKSGVTDMNRAAVVGFCWGGRQTWLYAERNPKLKAAVAWYGPLHRPTTPNTPKNPPDLISELKVPVLGQYGGLDKSIPQDQVADMNRQLAAAGGGSKIVVFPDAGHAFFADYRPSYVKADAEESWRMATAWLKQHGV